MNEFYPPNTHSADHPYGEHVVLLSGATRQEQYENTIQDLHDACAALVDVTSGTTLLERIDDWSTYCDADDLDTANNGFGVEIVDVYTSLKLAGAGERDGNNWPSVAADKASIDAIFAARAP